VTAVASVSALATAAAVIVIAISGPFGDISHESTLGVSADLGKKSACAPSPTGVGT
jgi:hypothetical protein